MTIARSFSEIPEGLWHSIREKNQILDPFSRIEWHKTWYDTLGAPDTLLIAITKKVIIPLMQREHSVSFSGGRELADYLDAIGADSDKPEAWRELLGVLSKQGITHLTLPNIPESSSTLAFFRIFNKATTITVEDTTPTIILPSSWETYLVSLNRHNRHELKRKMHKFDREHPGITVATSEANRAAVTSLLGLMDKDPAKKSFLTPHMRIFFEHITRALGANARIRELKKDTIVIASVLEFIEGNSVFLYNSGFDETLFSGSGFYLKTKAVEAAIAEKYKHYNFLQGKERYKYDLGAKDFLVYTVILTVS